MSTMDAGTAEEEQPALYPTYEALCGPPIRVRLSIHAQRLFWALDGPLTTAISVMEKPWTPDSLEPYFQQTSGEGTWHAISQLPLTEPKVSSITVGVYHLDWWEDNWFEMHREHYDCGDNADNDEDEVDLTHFLTCCGVPRPVGKAVKVVVKPATRDNGFVTIHDYLSVVHPWLMSVRGDILWALGMEQGDDEPLPSETELLVNSDAAEHLMIENRADWIKSRRHMPSLMSKAWVAEYEQMEGRQII